ncbi:MAG: hypothetical protein QXT45_06245 [Candidatus Bilamarchaeaceae archaeon]
MNKLLSSVLFRIKNWKTTVGGGVLGVIGAGILGKIEEQTGCHFASVFGSIDWGQIIIFVLSQLFGLFVTDGDKKVNDS